MATVLDVARYIVEKRGPLSAMKLQKLCYYSQAWALVWDEGVPLFDEDFEAWAFGPVAPTLYACHRGVAQVASDLLAEGDTTKLNEQQVETIDAVLEAYGDKSAHWLSELTHSEKPWKDARDGRPPGAFGQDRISKAAMQQYYDSLTSQEADPVRDLPSD
ncbi:MAG: type II toxin-antitoxin system antitoxin SocA domain-containing protein [Planctomycetota bacterium]